MTSNLQRYVPEDHPAVRILWRQVIAARKAQSATGAGEYGIGYATGFRDGISNAYATVTGLSRQQVGDRARAAARDGS